MPKDKKKARLTLAEVAAELRAVADELAEGKLRLGSTLIDIGEPLFLKTKREFKEEVAFFTLSIKMPLPEAPAAAVPPPAGGEPGPQSPPSAAGPARNREERPSNKRLKKEIGRLWKSACRQIEADASPAPAEAKRLLADCREYALFAEAAWQADWDACCRTVEACLAAAASGDRTKARALIAEVNGLTKECHKRHK